MNESGQDFLKVNSSKEFNELIHIGHLVRNFEWHQHKFEIRTLKVEEELVVGQLVKEFKDSIAEEKAVAVALAAASLVSVNDKPFMPAYEKSAFVSIRERFVYIKENWNWVIVETINAEYVQLLAELYETIEAVENLSKADRTSLNSLSDPLIDQES